jgi:hypothetical protein
VEYRWLPVRRRRQLVSAFRVNGRGDASAAGSYVIPGSASGALYFTLVGQTSHERVNSR